jgi:hypothetical protein
MESRKTLAEAAKKPAIPIEAKARGNVRNRNACSQDLIDIAQN